MNVRFVCCPSYSHSPATGTYLMVFSWLVSLCYSLDWMITGMFACYPLSTTGARATANQLPTWPELGSGWSGVNTGGKHGDNNQSGCHGCEPKAGRKWLDMKYKVFGLAPTASAEEFVIFMVNINNLFSMVETRWSHWDLSQTDGARRESQSCRRTRRNSMTRSERRRTRIRIFVCVLFFNNVKPRQIHCWGCLSNQCYLLSLPPPVFHDKPITPSRNEGLLIINNTKLYG